MNWGEHKHSDHSSLIGRSEKDMIIIQFCLYLYQWFSKLCAHQNYLEDLLKQRKVDPEPRDSASKSRVRPKIYISNKLPNDAYTAGIRTGF